MIIMSQCSSVMSPKPVREKHDSSYIIYRQAGDSMQLSWHDSWHDRRHDSWHDSWHDRRQAGMIAARQAGMIAARQAGMIAGMIGGKLA